MDQQSALSKICPACAAINRGTYCNQCGEYLLPARFSFKNILLSIPDIFFDLESGLFYTLKLMIIRPHIAVSNFLSGDRSRHIKPLKLVLFMSGLYALLFISFNIQGTETMYEGLVNEKSAKFLDEQYVKLQSIINVIALPFLSFLTWLFFLKKGLYYGEHLMMNSFIVGTVLFINILLFPIMLIKNGTPWVDGVTNFLTLITIYITCKAYYGMFYEKSRRNLLVALLKTMAIIVILSIWYLVTTPAIIYCKLAWFGE